MLQTYKKKGGEPSADERNVRLLDELLSLQVGSNDADIWLRHVTRC